MSVALVLSVLWLVAASLATPLPSTRDNEVATFVLVAAGVPLVGLVTMQHGPWIALILLGAGVSALRWPILHMALQQMRTPTRRHPAD